MWFVAAASPHVTQLADRCGAVRGSCAAAPTRYGSPSPHRIISEPLMMRCGDTATTKRTRIPSFFEKDSTFLPSHVALYKQMWRVLKWILFHFAFVYRECTPVSPWILHDMGHSVAIICCGKSWVVYQIAHLSCQDGVLVKPARHSVRALWNRRSNDHDKPKRPKRGQNLNARHRTFGQRSTWSFVNHCALSPPLDKSNSIRSSDDLISCYAVYIIIWASIEHAK